VGGENSSLSEALVFVVNNKNTISPSHIAGITPHGVIRVIRQIRVNPHDPSTVMPAQPALRLSS
jgi:hypothetical protein